MAYLSKTSRVSNQTAGLIVFLAWYLSAAITTLFVTGYLQRILILMTTMFILVLIFMTLAYMVSRKVKRTDIVDMAWGPAFVVATVASFVLSDFHVPVGQNIQTLVTALVIVWAARLTYSIYRRLKSHPEDKRYVALRRKWKGNPALNTYLRIFVTQAVLATVISISVIHINSSLPTPLGSYAYIGLVIWMAGFLFESIGDWQLGRFLAESKNKGKLMMSGLWKYTRHPNYFGEATMWLGIFVIALSTPYGWVAVIAPVLIMYLLLFVSGVPMTEKSFANKPGWDAYKKRTSKFLPLPPSPERY
jgi:steroid 5-alpha reductase family enzyme